MAAGVAGGRRAVVRKASYLHSEPDDMHITSGGQSVQVDIEDRFFRALVEIRNVLGPDSFGCSEPICEGCQAEAAEALRIANRALGFLGEKP